MRQLIDSHIHFWQPDELTYGWLEELPAINKPYLPTNLPASGDGWTMEKLVFVQADVRPEQGLAEAQWVAGLDDARIAGIVAFAALEHGDDARAELEKLTQLPKVKGVRRLIQSEPLGFSVQPDFVAGVQAVADYGFSFDICVLHPQLPDVIELVKQCPKVSFVLDHIGKPDIKNGLIDTWREQITTLAGFDNVWCKLSGMVTEADHEKWTIDDLRPYANHILDAFGTSRVMFGGDYPVVELACDYPRWVQTALELTVDLSDDEKDALFYANAAQFYRL